MLLRRSTFSLGGSVLANRKRQFGRAEVDRFEKVTAQLKSAHAEIQALAKKSPNDAVNSFKLGFVNAIVAECNELFGEQYVPLQGFASFDEDEVPSNSDVTFVIAQYIGTAEKFRSDHIYQEHGCWYYQISGGEQIRTSPPGRLAK